MPKGGSPIGSYGLVKASGINVALLNLYTIAAFTQMTAPLFSLLGGIGILKLKGWAIKYILIIFSISVISQLIAASIALSTPSLRQTMFSKQSFYLFFVVNIIVLYFFTRPKVKEQFN